MWVIAIIFVILVYITTFALMQTAKMSPEEEMAYMKWQEEMKNKSKENKNKENKIS